MSQSTRNTAELLNRLIETGEARAFLHLPTGEIRYFLPRQLAELNMGEYSELPTPTASVN